MVRKMYRAMSVIAAFLMLIISGCGSDVYLRFLIISNYKTL